MKTASKIERHLARRGIIAAKHSGDKAHYGIVEVQRAKRKQIAAKTQFQSLS